MCNSIDTVWYTCESCLGENLNESDVYKSFMDVNCTLKVYANLSILL